MPEAPTEQASGAQRRFPCVNCGAEVLFAPGVSRLKCPYCGSETDIPDSATEPVEELDFRTFVAELATREETVDRIVSQCDTCGARVEFPDNVTSHTCPFCGSNIVAVGKSEKLLRPRGLLPFHLDRKGTLAAYADWIKGRWFAPNDLKKTARLDARLTGIYLPFWTYDANVTTDYRGMRGEYYWVTEHYTGSDGKRHSRQVRKTRWYPASGRVFDAFDDILVVATRSLEQKKLEALEPWDLGAIQPYQPEYLAGFGAESYVIDLAEGFVRAQELMDPQIRATISRDIGGDEQQILHMTPRYNDISFKHILLPVWIMAYRYKKKTYQVIVNARTGEVIGDRPYSVLKITALVLTILAIIAAVAIAVSMKGSP
jgi:predicted RNA-binding Zn-ribbon protein involved in translation (DUF1610 family)